MKDLPLLHEGDGFALMEQWVQGGNLCQEGTLFLSAAGVLVDFP